MADNYQDDDALGSYPSAASPLTSLGLDPDQVRANPELLNAFTPHTSDPSSDKPPTSGPAQMPTGEDQAAPTPPPTTPSPSAAPAAAPQSATDYGMAGLASLNQNAKLAQEATAAIPTSSPEVDRLAAQRAKLATPAPLYDPQSGKMLSQTTGVDANGNPVTINPKPSVGRRIWRGVRGGLVGLATAGLPGALVGAIEPGAIHGGQAYGAPNDAYQKEETTREQQLGSTDDSLKTAFSNWKNQVDAAKAKGSDLRAAATLGKDETTGSVGMQDAATAAQKEKDEVAKTAADSPAAKDAAALKLSNDQYQQRKTRLDTDPSLRNLSPINKLLYALNGKVPDPREPNEAEINAGAAARALVVFKAQHGGQGPQTLDDFNNIQAAARGMMGRGGGKGDPNADEEVSSIVADSIAKKQEFADNWVRQPDGNYTSPDFTKTMKASEFQDKIEGFRTAANAKLAKKGAMIDGSGNIIKKGEASTVESGNPDDLVTVIDGDGNRMTGPRRNLAEAQKRDKKLKVVQ